MDTLLRWMRSYPFGVIWIGGMWIGVLSIMGGWKVGLMVAGLIAFCMLAGWTMKDDTP